MDFLGQTMEQQASTPHAETGIPGVPSPHFALVNYLFPGYSVIASAANAYVGADMNAYMPALVSVMAIYVLWQYSRHQVTSFVNGYFRSSVTVRTDDEIYNMVMLWLSRQKFCQNSRHIVANTNDNYRNRFWYMYEDDSDDDGDDDSDGDEDDHVNTMTGASSSQKKALRYTPGFGTHLFWYKMRPLTFDRVLRREQNSYFGCGEKEELCISCYGRNTRILKELLLEAHQLHMRRDDHKTVIFRAKLAESHWMRCMSRLNRPFSTVILDEAVKQGLIDDVADYLSPVTRRWYANRGIPYRRGYLFYGPPGTGKSSLSLALAGHFRMKIYIFSLSSNAATEENLTTLFQDLPTRGVVLLEDIDSAGLTHTRAESPAPPAVPEAAATEGLSGVPNPSTSTGRVSLSGLLNILDGVASQEGRILIMTTNHIEKLDKALIRPGRIDMLIRFGLADSTMATSIFRAIYAAYGNEKTSIAKETDRDVAAAETLPAQKSAPMSERLNEQARIFGEKIPPLEFSAAEIQGLLLKHKRDPEGALQSVESWVVKMRKEKKERAEKEAEKARQKADEAKQKKKKDDDAEDEKKTKKKQQQQQQQQEENEEQGDEDTRHDSAKSDAGEADASTNKPQQTTSDSGYGTR